MSGVRPRLCAGAVPIRQPVPFQLPSRGEDEVARCQPKPIQPADDSYSVSWRVPSSSPAHTSYRNPPSSITRRRRGALPLCIWPANFARAQSPSRQQQSPYASQPVPPVRAPCSSYVTRTTRVRPSRLQSQRRPAAAASRIQADIIRSLHALNMVFVSPHAHPHCSGAIPRRLPPCLISKPTSAARCPSPPSHHTRPCRHPHPPPPPASTPPHLPPRTLSRSSPAFRPPLACVSFSASLAHSQLAQRARLGRWADGCCAGYVHGR